MKRQNDSLRGALYRFFDLPAADCDEKFYQTLVAQRRANAEKLLAASGLRERSGELLAAIAAGAGRKTISLGGRVRTPRRGRLFMLAGAAAAAVLAVVLLLPVAPGQADRLVVTAWSGSPQISGAGTTRPPEKGMRIGQAGGISTGRGGSLTLAGGGNLFCLGADTVARFTQLAPGERFGATLVLDRGIAAFAFAAGRGHSFVVRTVRGEVSITGTVFAVALERGRLRVAVRRGRVQYRVTRTAPPQLLAAGQGLSVGPDGRIQLGEVDDSFAPLTGLLDRIGPPEEKGKPAPFRLPLRERKRLDRVSAAVVTNGEVRIQLKNGSTIRGRIVHDEPGLIRVRTGFGVMNVNRDTIDKIEKTGQ